MTTRTALLFAIRAAPDDDLPRLVYADYLDENPGTDLDAATSEFIRISCVGKKCPRMPRAAYEWIGVNWRRLIPGVCRLGVQVGANAPIFGYQRGRCIRGFIRIPNTFSRPGPGNNFLHTVKRAIGLNFSRGFVDRLDITSFTLWEYIETAFRADQPVASVPFVDNETGVARR